MAVCICTCVGVCVHIHVLVLVSVYSGVATGSDLTIVWMPLLQEIMADVNALTNQSADLKAQLVAAQTSLAQFDTRYMQLTSALNDATALEVCRS